MHRDERNRGDEIARLVGSLELITARMLEMTVRDGQLASGQTPELRKLFDRWIECVGDDLIRRVEEEETLDIRRTAQEMGLEPASLLSLLLSLERMGKVEIRTVIAVRGNGENRELCDCFR